MSTIKEINRRTAYQFDDGMGCGPASSTAIIAEITLDVDGQLVYLHGEWVDIAGDYFFEATTESLFDAFEKIYNATSEEEEKQLIDEKNKIEEGKIKEDQIFEPFYAELEKMINDEMDDHGIGYFHENDEYVEIDEEEDK